jgi:hypothetical protein
MEAAFEGIVGQLPPWGLWRTDIVALARLSLVRTDAALPARLASKHKNTETQQHQQSRFQYSHLG